MGWAGPMPNAEGRMVGYAVDATCDTPGCDTAIDRGLAYVCGDMHDGGDYGCGRYFCHGHLIMGIPGQICEPCNATWEKEHPDEVEADERAFQQRCEALRHDA